MPLSTPRCRAKHHPLMQPSFLPHSQCYCCQCEQCPSGCFQMAICGLTWQCAWQKIHAPGSAPQELSTPWPKLPTCPQPEQLAAQLDVAEPFPLCCSFADAWSGGLPQASPLLCRCCPAASSPPAAQACLFSLPHADHSIPCSTQSSFKGLWPRLAADNSLPILQGSCLADTQSASSTCLQTSHMVASR